MSMEDIYTAHTEALNAHAKALNAFVAASKSGTTAGADKPKATASADKPKATTKKAVTKDQLTAAFGEYLSVKDKDEKKERAANVVAITKHFQAERISTIDESEYGAALAFLKQFEAGENPFAEEGDEDEGDSSLV